MPRTQIDVTQILYSGVVEPAEVSSDATNDHYVAANDGRIFVRVRNTNAGSQDVTVKVPGTYFGRTIADDVIPIAAGAVKYIGPWETQLYNQVDGSVYIDVTIATDLKFLAFRL